MLPPLSLAAWSGIGSRNDLGVEHRRIDSLLRANVLVGVKDTGALQLKMLEG